MLKRMTVILLCIVLAFGISAYAANTADENAAEQSAASEEAPMQGGGRRGGGGGGDRDGMEMPPDDAMRGETRDMPEGEGAPPESNENNQHDTPDGAPEIDANHSQGGGMNASTGDQGGMNNGESPQNTDAAGKAADGIVTFLKTYSTPITAVILLVFAFAFVIFYKRKQY